VEHWQHVQQVEADVNATKFNLLLEQQQHGSRLLQLQSHKVCHGGLQTPRCGARLSIVHASLNCLKTHVHAMPCLQLGRSLAADVPWHTCNLSWLSTSQHSTAHHALLSSPV
jgi:hypothetical protein